jgi:hypothetical protein
MFLTNKKLFAVETSKWVCLLYDLNWRLGLSSLCLERSCAATRSVQIVQIVQNVKIIGFFFNVFPKASIVSYSYKMILLDSMLMMLSGVLFRCLIHKAYLRFWRKFWEFSLMKHIQFLKLCNSFYFKCQAWITMADIKQKILVKN